MENQDLMRITLAYRLPTLETPILQDITVPKGTKIEKLLSVIPASSLAVFHPVKHDVGKQLNQGELKSEECYSLGTYYTQKDLKELNRIITSLNANPYSIKKLVKKTRAEKSEKPHNSGITMGAFLAQQNDLDKIRDFKRSLYDS